MANLFNLSGRVAVVIGATSGLGRTIALGLAEHGADVVPTGRREDKVRDVSTEIEAQGRTSFAYASDVRDRQSIDRLRDAVLERFSRVDILINAAGHTLKRPAAEIGEAEAKN